MRISSLIVVLACAAAFYAALHVLLKPKIVAAGYGWIVFAATVLPMFFASPIAGAAADRFESTRQTAAWASSHR